MTKSAKMLSCLVLLFHTACVGPREYVVFRKERVFCGSESTVIVMCKERGINHRSTFSSNNMMQPIEKCFFLIEYVYRLGGAPFVRRVSADDLFCFERDARKNGFDIAKFDQSSAKPYDAEVLFAGDTFKAREIVSPLSVEFSYRVLLAERKGADFLISANAVSIKSVNCIIPVSRFVVYNWNLVQKRYQIFFMFGANGISWECPDEIAIVDLQTGDCKKVSFRAPTHRDYK